LLALLAVVLAGAGVAVAAPGLPREVVRQVRVALCIVGGDVCRAADAAAAGLDPCVMEDGASETSETVTVGFASLGGQGAWSVEERSDGRLLVTFREGIDGGATAGAGVRLGPLVDLHADGTGGVGFGRGKAWEVPSRAALGDFVRVIARHPFDFEKELPAPAYTFVQGGRFVTGEAGAGLAGTPIGSAGSGAARDALGRRVGRTGTTWYYDVGGDLSTLLPSLDVAGRMVFEYTDGSPPVLGVRATRGGSTTTEFVGRQVLSDPADAARVRAFLATALPLTGRALLDGRRILSRLREAGTLQRFTYAVESGGGSVGYGAAAVVALSVEHSESMVRRRLVDAVVLGDRAARRVDCLGL
jgi:hypothetical protein